MAGWEPEPHASLVNPSRHTIFVERFGDARRGSELFFTVRLETWGDDGAERDDDSSVAPSSPLLRLDVLALALGSGRHKLHELTGSNWSGSLRVVSGQRYVDATSIPDLPANTTLLFQLAR